MGRASSRTDGLKRGPWRPEEDLLLIKYIETHGAGRWRSVPQNAGLMRCGKSCRLRWMNYLRPDIKRGQISPDEEELITRLHNLLGNRWSLIAGRVPGRTGNEVKNYWNTYLCKKLYSNRIIVPAKGDPGVCNPSTVNACNPVDGQDDEMVENVAKVRIEGDDQNCHSLPDNNNYNNVNGNTGVGVSVPSAGINYHSTADKLWIELEEDECIKLQQLYTKSRDTENFHHDPVNYQKDFNGVVGGPESERAINRATEHESVKASLGSEPKAAGDVVWPFYHNYGNCLEWSALDSWEIGDHYRHVQCGGDGYVGRGCIGTTSVGCDQLLSESGFGFPFPS